MDGDLLEQAKAALGEAASSQVVDITDLDALGRAHADTEASVGPVSILVNSAASRATTRRSTNTTPPNGAGSSRSI